MGFFQNTCKPEGLAGKVMVKMMNNGHAKLAEWGFSHIEPKRDGVVLDAGCGGGANLAVWLSKCPEGIVTGLDYSEISVENSKKLNMTAIEEKRCIIQQGSVDKMPFADDTYDYISAFETVYFWPGLEKCFREAFRILKTGGQFLICNESDGTNPSDDKWTTKIEGMTIYKAEELNRLLNSVGFKDVKIDQNEKHWISIVAKK